MLAREGAGGAGASELQSGAAPVVAVVDVGAAVQKGHDGGGGTRLRRAMQWCAAIGRRCIHPRAAVDQELDERRCKKAGSAVCGGTSAHLPINLWVDFMHEMQWRQAVVRDGRA